MKLESKQQLRSKFDHQLKCQFGTELGNRLHFQILNYLWDDFRDQIHYQLRNHLIDVLK